VGTELTSKLMELKLFLSNYLVQINFHQKTLIFKLHKKPLDNRNLGKTPFKAI